MRGRLRELQSLVDKKKKKHARGDVQGTEKKMGSKHFVFLDKTLALAAQRIQHSACCDYLPKYLRTRDANYSQGAKKSLKSKNKNKNKRNNTIFFGKR